MGNETSIERSEEEKHSRERRNVGRGVGKLRSAKREESKAEETEKESKAKNNETTRPGPNEDLPSQSTPFSHAR